MWSFASTGCGYSTCKTYCDWVDDCEEPLNDDDYDNCVDHCQVDYQMGDGDCQDDFDEYIECLDDEGCSLLRCAEELSRMSSECQSDWT